MHYQLKKPNSIKDKKRVGRGPGSGHGKTCCRGQKGQMCRSGSKRRPWFEGGQMPLQRRVPKRGFNNLFKKVYQIVNLYQITILDSYEINPELLAQKGIIKKTKEPVKILGYGEIKKPQIIIADAFTKAAKKKIELAGGEARLR